MKSETPRTDEFYSGLNTDLSHETERDEILRFARCLECELSAVEMENRRLVKECDAMRAAGSNAEAHRSAPTETLKAPKP